MSRKVGPLPLGVWILAVAGGLGVAWWIRRQQSQNADDEDDTGTGRSTDTAPGIGGAAGGAFGGGGTGASADGSYSPRPASNEEWYTLASKALLDTHSYNELSIDTALKAYLQGSRQLTPGESAIVSHAIRLVGPPPVPTPSPPPGSGGTTQPDPPDDDDEDPPGRPNPFPETPREEDPRPPAPSAGSGDKWHTVGSGDNLAKIAQKYYGSSNVESNRNRIYRANSAEIEWQARRHGRSDSSGGVYIYSGTRLLIPGPFGSTSDMPSGGVGNVVEVVVGGGKSKSKSSGAGGISGGAR